VGGTRNDETHLRRSKQKAEKNAWHRSATNKHCRLWERRRVRTRHHSVPCRFVTLNTNARVPSPSSPFSSVCFVGASLLCGLSTKRSQGRVARNRKTNETNNTWHRVRRRGASILMSSAASRKGPTTITRRRRREHAVSDHQTGRAVPLRAWCRSVSTGRSKDARVWHFRRLGPRDENRHAGAHAARLATRECLDGSEDSKPQSASSACKRDVSRTLCSARCK